MNKLAPYAVTENNSRGRLYPEEEHEYRSIFQRDRDRIVHSTAFRRLEYKTQVFVYHEGDLYRTRLTHTLEVLSSINTLELNLLTESQSIRQGFLKGPLGGDISRMHSRNMVEPLISDTCKSFTMGGQDETK